MDDSYLNIVSWTWNCWVKKHVCCFLVTHSCPTVYDLMDCSPPGSSVHGILQAGILEWVAISSSGASSPSRDQTQSMFKFLIETIKLLLGKVVLTFHETHNPCTCLPMFSYPDLPCKPVLPAPRPQKFVDLISTFCLISILSFLSLIITKVVFLSQFMPFESLLWK